MGTEQDNDDVISNMVDESVIREAEGQGWVTKDKYRGDEKDWVEADVFVKRGREILPILRKNNENLIRELNSTKEQLKEFRQTAEEFKTFQKESYERKIGEYKDQIDRLKESRAQAISDGDGQKVNALDDAIDTAKEAISEAKAATKDATKTTIEAPSSIDPTLQSWLDRNEWFGKDTRFTKMTNAIGEDLRASHPELQGVAFLDKLDEVLREEFPERFGKGKRPTPSHVESGSGRGRSASAAHSYDNLPAEAKAACDRYTKQKLMTREQYVADYDWS
ncbi:hypothetical protein UFOVP1590_28 [uncultured Caudovirales phage]|uniref:Uncharacterized protein n=1 Tax=uncultured Caudovirales phage TaxID=2100421 RepID=A0A6J5SQQ9_9CAUD|nr:hypothetical protein UFOVP1590_28 [uncultured Caudovirales phage]